ncbi:MAG: lamin tail domain-containing protein [Bacteroidota bacterium]
MPRLLLCAALALTFSATVSAQNALSGVIINEILPDPNGANDFDTDGDGGFETTDEFIELYNTTGAAVDISGWEIYDNTFRRYTFPAASSIPANGYVVVVGEYTGTEPPGYFEAGSLGLGNSGDIVQLRDPVADQFIAILYNGETDPPTSPGTQVGSTENFGSDSDGLSIQRSPDGSTTFVNDTPTPVAANSGTVSVADNVLINEVDAKSAAGVATDDAADFVELYTPFAGNIALDGLVLVLFDGASDESYGAVDLDGISTDADGFAVIGQVAGADAALPGDGRLLNGVAAVALYEGDASDFPNGTAATTTDRRDNVVYGSTADARDDGLITALGGSTFPVIQYAEDYRAAPEAVSLQLLNLDFATVLRPETAKSGVIATSGLLYPAAPTPRALNPETTRADYTDQVSGNGDTDGTGAQRGWRHLAVPGFQDFFQTDFDIDDLAGINLVQGVPGGTNPQQYPTFGVNIFTDVTGPSGVNNGYVPPADTDEEVVPGDGFLWYFYDQGNPGGGDGTSVGYDLADPAFEFALDVTPPDELVNGFAPYELAKTGAAPFGGASRATKAGIDIPGFYLIGNPYAYPYALGGISADTGTLQTTFAVWNPDVSTTTSGGQQIRGSFETLTANTTDAFTGGALGVWNGAFAEVATSGGPSTAVTFTFPSFYNQPVSSATFIGRGAAVAERQLRFRLEGTLSDGTGIADVSPVVRILDGARTDWDMHDGTKMGAFEGAFGLIALVGDRYEERWRQSALSLPFETDLMEIPMDFTASDAGTFKLSWDIDTMPEGWNAVLRDRETGMETNILTERSYAFSAAASDWTERFELVIASRVIVASEGETEAAFALSAPAPNPTRGVSEIAIEAAGTSPVRVAIYDALGREVAVLHDGPLAAGVRTTLRLDTASMAPAVYIIRADDGASVLTQRLTVTR